MSHASISHSTYVMVNSCLQTIQERSAREFWEDFEQQEKVFKEKVAHARELAAERTVSRIVVDEYTGCPYFGTRYSTGDPIVHT